MLIPVGLFAAFMGLGVVVQVVRGRIRIGFIKSYKFSPELVAGVREDHPEIDGANVPLVLDALRQWLLVARRSEGTPLAMPSRVADDAWHRFILLTREYHAFCKKAYGHYLDHTPNAVASKVDPDAMPRTLALLDTLDLESVDGLPLLFAVDRVVGCDRPRLWHRDTVSWGYAECSTGDLPERDSGGCCG